jgi:nicotinate-nucleotide adenylyltransferase
LRAAPKAYRGMTIGLFGGSFNPAHEGHAHAAETALRMLGLNKIWWLVTPQNPLKDKRNSAPLAQRIASARAVARGRAMVVTDIETSWGTQYSIDLVRKLRARFPGVRFVYILGTDNLLNLHCWRRWQDLMRELPFAFVARPGAGARAQFSPAARRFAHARTQTPRTLMHGAPPAWAVLNAKLISASSTTLRYVARFHIN